MMNILENLTSFHFEDFTILFSGFLLTLSVYHFLLYFQHKDRVYLLYSLYTFLIFSSSYPNTESSFFGDATLNPDPYLHYFIIPREWAYNTLYLLFAKALVEFNIHKPKLDKFLNKSVVVLFLVLIITMFIAYIFTNPTIVGVVFAYFFSPAIAILALISFYALYSMKTGLKYYVLIGSFIYMILAESSFYFASDEQKATVIFYVGIIIENILFSLALGYKQKLILQEKNESQHNLIIQLKENDKLRNRMQQQLEEDVATYSKKAEEERFNTLKAQYEKELLELRMSSLRSQMNPHFIFNSLNSIKQYIISNEKQNAVYYLNKFSKLIRSILDATQNKEIPLADEIETLKLYLNIENIRFQNEIVYEIKIEDNLQINTIKVPSLILQPFIENALWHGLSLKKGEKLLTIEFSKPNKSFLEIKMQDNGIGRKKSAYIKQKKIHKKKSIGINLTKERLKNFSKDYKNTYSLKFEDLYDKNQNATGTNVIIKIPLL